LGVLASGSSERELFYGALVAIILVFGIVYGAKWIDHRERTYPRYAGVLLPQPVIQNGALADNSVRLQIGNSGTFFEGAGIDDILSVLKRDQFNLSVGNGKILVSTKVRDDADNVIAEIEDNEWKIAPPPSTYDRNYSDNALEVKNTKGDIVLQVRMIGNTVQLQGIWWKILASRKLRMVVREAPECKQSPSNCGSQIVFCEPNHECQKILAIFKYPGDSHLGELAR